ncbi:MAG: tetratricopeptide repeat protein [Gammaproteobacteria bacterium]|nr:tetratricopeptide repeat protein [Gammaproteobacteria bacterium]
MNKPGLALICVMFFSGGCASTPETGNDAIAAKVSDNSMDILFATEFPVASEDDALTRADQATQEGEIDKALFYLVRALQFRPDNVPLLLRIGEIQLLKQNSNFAKRAFLLAQHYDPDNSAALEGVGLIYVSEGRDEQAIHNLTRAVAIDASLWRSHNVLGVYADKAGDYAAAQRHYERALAVNPGAAHVLNNFGYSRYLAGDVDGAIRYLLEAANDRGFFKAWANLGKIYAEEGRYREAIRTYRLVMSEAAALNNAGFAAIENGDLTEAERYISEAIRLSPTYFPSAQDNLLLLQELQGGGKNDAT